MDISDSRSLSFEQEPVNFEEKLLCVLVLDTSGSMNEDDNIVKLNDGLKIFKEQIVNSNSGVKDKLEISIVTFDSKVRVVQNPSLFEGMQIPTLVAHGQTQLVEAIRKAKEIVTERKKWYKDKGISYFRPWIVVMTDGDPYPEGQDIDGLSLEIEKDFQDKRYVIQMIGVGNDVSNDTLSKLSTTDLRFKPKRIDGTDFGTIFKFLSVSSGSIVNGDSLPEYIKGFDIVSQ